MQKASQLHGPGSQHSYMSANSWGWNSWEESPKTIEMHIELQGSREQAA